MEVHCLVTQRARKKEKEPGSEGRARLPKARRSSESAIAAEMLMNGDLLLHGGVFSKCPQNGLLCALLE